MSRDAEDAAIAPRPFRQGYLKLSLVTCPLAMTPAVTGAEEVRFHILNQATGTAGLSRFVHYRRERGVVLKPKDRGIVLWTLRFADEVRDPKSCFAGIKDVEVRKDAPKPAEGVIDERAQDWKSSPAHDRVQASFLKTITEKSRQLSSENHERWGTRPQARSTSPQAMRAGEGGEAGASGPVDSLSGTARQEIA